MYRSCILPKNVILCIKEFKFGRKFYFCDLEYTVYIVIQIPSNKFKITQEVLLIITILTQALHITIMLYLKNIIPLYKLCKIKC